MNFRNVLVFIFICVLQKSKCGELDDEIDDKLTDPTGTTSNLPRHLSIFSDSISSFVKSISLLSYDTSIISQSINNYYLSFPDKKSLLPLYFNLTDQTSKAFLGNLVFLGLGAYLVSYLPFGAISRRYGNDEFVEELGFGLQRDSDITFDEFGNEITFDEFGNEITFDEFGNGIDSYDYQYPDSLDFNTFRAASEPKQTTRKINGDLVDRKGSIGKKRPNSIEKPGIFEDLSSKFWSYFGSPVKRAFSESRGIQGFYERYEDYWKQRRNGFRRRSSKIEENTFRNKERNNALTGSSELPRLDTPIPYNGQPQPYYSPSPELNSYKGSESYLAGPSWPGQTNQDKEKLEQADFGEQNFGVDGGKGDNPVEYVYSQKK